MINFNEMNISDNIKTALSDMGFESPTPIQDEVIPLILEGKDVIAQAPTGTGKTCAFGIPVINNIDEEAEHIQAVILCPTRELVIQTEVELKEVAKYSKNIRIVSIYGGQNFDRQLAGLRKRPQIIIGTTGRVMDHLRRKSLKLGQMKILILDEVDEMLNMGFREDIDVILESVPKERQTVLFSATMPKEIVNISKLYQIDPLSIKIQHEKSDIPNINQYYVKVSESEKIDALISIIKDKGYNLALVFCNTKKRVDELSAFINEKGINAEGLHGDLRQHQRDKTMKRFRGGDLQMLIATDVAARGIDVDNIDVVFNFDVPHDEEYYVHRIGRTSRAKNIGDSYTFVTEKQMYAIKNFENYIKSPILKASFSKDAMVKEPDQKLFDRTLKLIKKGDLTTYREYLLLKLEEFKEKYDRVEILDVAAALLMQLNEVEADKSTVLSEAPRLALKEIRVRKPEISGGVKFFMNIGTRDNCNEESITKFIAQKAAIPFEKILSIKCLENFSFANVSEGFNKDMESLNGIKFGKRILAVEVATPNTSKQRPKKDSDAQTEPKPDPQNKNFAPKAKSFSKDKSEPKDKTPKDKTAFKGKSSFDNKNKEFKIFKKKR